ncbi:MAG: hypothetical protein ABW250_22555 [Pyrinomonadaceae bacterium]
MITDDPHNQTEAAATEEPVGEPTPERAELLGTTALTARVRCPCGKRQDVDREDWQWNGVTLCSRCGRGLLDHSLQVVSRAQALAMIEGRKPTGSELRALRHVEMSLRDFTLRHGEHPRWYWSPPTNRMAEEVGRLLAELDESRRDRGSPPVVGSGRAFLDKEDDESAETEVTAADDEDDDELGDEGYGDEDEALNEGEE